MTNPVPPSPTPHSNEAFDAEYRRRQKARARITALILFALVILFFAIAIVRMH